MQKHHSKCERIKKRVSNNRKVMWNKLKRLNTNKEKILEDEIKED